jgi:transposase
MAWSDTLGQWVSWHSPQDFGYFRSIWSCEILSNLLREERSILIPAEHVRQWMHRVGYVWRSPRPVVDPQDPMYAAKMQATF